MKINFSNIRRLNLLKVEQLNLPVNEALPYLDDVQEYKSQEEVIHRALCIYAIIAMSFGLNKEHVIKWLEREKLINYLTEKEESLVFEQNKELKFFQIKVEALWGLSWALNLFEEINYSSLCEDNLSSFFPKISKYENIEAFKVKANLRTIDELLLEADLIYCIHWGMVENDIKGKKNKVPLYVIEERRRAIDWILYDEIWDEVSFDT